MLYAPDYYPCFHCIAADCRHSCCVGWEIDIDAETRAVYADVPGEFGRRLAESIVDDADGAHFRLTPDERCPLLREDGLCRLILHLGEDALCQICTDHPRFRNFFSGRTELGLGLCCEAAGELILSAPAPMQLIAIADDGDCDPLTEDEKELLALRARALTCASNPNLPIAARMAEVLDCCGAVLPDSLLAWRPIYVACNRLDPLWDAELDALDDLPIPRGWDEPFSRLLGYFLYRHLPDALTDGRIAERAAFAVLSTRIIGARFAAGEHTLARLVELARLYSSEIEYDTDNVDALLDAIAAVRTKSEPCERNTSC